MSKALTIAGSFRSPRQMALGMAVAATGVALMVAAAWLIAALLGTGVLPGTGQHQIAADGYRDYGLRHQAAAIESYPDLGIRARPALTVESYPDLGLRVSPAGTVESYPDLGLRVSAAGTVESYPDLGLRISPAALADEPYLDFGLRHRPAADQ